MFTGRRSVLNTPRLVGTAGLVFAAVGGCVHYLFRDPVESPGGVSAVAYLAARAGEIWPLVFGVVAVALVVAAVTGRAVVAVHAVTGGVFTAYGVALAVGAVLSTPVGGLVTAAFALALALNAFVLTRSYARGHAWTRL